MNVPWIGTPRAIATRSEELRREIDTLQTMRDLFTHTGNRSRADEVGRAIEKKKALMAKADAPPRELTADEMTAVVARLDHGTVPGAGLSEDLRAHLDAFARLHDGGVTFSDSSWREIPAKDAFSQLMRFAWHGHDQQVMWRSYEDGNIVMSTLRPEYLKGLAYYLEETKNGHVFYTETNNGYDPVNDPQSFLKAYQDDPESAPVKAADGTYVPLREARQRDLEWARKMMNVDEQGTPIQDRPQVQDLGETVSIGGIVVRKRRD